MSDKNVYYCVGCAEIHPRRSFYKSYNNMHGNGTLPFCKDFIKEKVYNSKGENPSMERLQSILMQMNIPYLDSVISPMIKTESDPIGQYFAQFNSLPQYRGLEWSDSDFGELPEDDNSPYTKEDVENFQLSWDIEVFWGKGFKNEDYSFLELELSNWTKTHKCDNQAETTLLKEICIKVLEIRKLREDGKGVSKHQKELQELMKTASVDPAKANVADAGKSLDSYGLWIKDIETTEPAEYFADKKLFKDFDGIGRYVESYIYRPLKNLLTGSRDFDIERDDD